MMRILQIKMICGGTPPEERTLDLSGSGVLSSGALGSGAALLEALCLALYGRGVPRPVGTPSPLDGEEGKKKGNAGSRSSSRPGMREAAPSDTGLPVP